MQEVFCQRGVLFGGPDHFRDSVSISSVPSGISDYHIHFYIAYIMSRSLILKPFESDEEPWLEMENISTLFISCNQVRWIPTDISRSFLHIFQTF